MKNKSHILLKNISTIWFIGYLPVAPGTYGSFVSLILVYLLRPSDLLIAILFGIFFLVGIVASHSAEITLKQKDSRHIIIDEFAGYFISIAFLEKEPVILILSFLLFRFFDIVKPPPIKKIENSLAGGFGIMFDDVLAGIYANLTMRILIIIYGYLF